MNVTEIEEIISRTVARTLAALFKPEPKPKPAKPAPPPPRELTETEKIVRHFEFLRAHGGIMAEGRYNRYGEMEWRFPRRR